MSAEAGAHDEGRAHPPSAFSGPVLAVAAGLLGRVLRVRSPQGTVALRLTEVEAYGGQGEDPGSHAFRGRTPRTEVMFGPPGHAYVYRSYGMHWCLNLVCGPAGAAAAVLLRAGEVIEGHDVVRTRRPGALDRDLARGPARLTRSLGVDGSDDGRPFDGGRLEIAGERSAVPAVCGPRVGVSGVGGTRPWRLWLPGEVTVSAYRAARPRPARGPAPVRVEGSRP